MWFLRLGVPLLAVLAATLARLGLEANVQQRLPLVTFVPAVLVTAWLAGWVSAAIATGLSALALHFVFMEPRWSLHASEPGSATVLALFAVVSALGTALIESQRRATGRAQRTARSLRRSRRRLAEQREWLEVTLASIGDAVIAADDRRRITFMNEVAASLTGWREEEGLGRGVEEVFRIVNERSRLPVENPLDRVLREGRVVGLANHTVLLSRDGTEHPIDDSGAPIRDAEGRVIGAVMVFRDVSERKKTEQALRESEARFRTMADDAPVLMWMSGADKLCHYFNRPWLEFTGRRFEQEMGIGWTENVHADDMGRCVAIYEAAFDAREPFRMEYRMRRFDGEYRWILDCGVPRFDAEGAFVGYIGSCIDITDRRNAEATVLRQKEEMEDFLSIVAHDLRHPVVSMHGLLSILREECRHMLSPDACENLDMSLSECDRMRDIIGQLGQVAKISHDEIRYVPVHLRTLVSGVLDRFRTRVAEKQVAVKVECPGEEVSIPRLQVEQALENLVENALEHGCRETGGRLGIGVLVSSGWVSMSVSDNGPGIAPRYHQRVFEIFRRLNPDHPARGTGVGLTAVQRLMRHVGGSVNLESEEGFGATFTISFPCRPGRAVAALPGPDGGAGQMRGPGREPLRMHGDQREQVTKGVAGERP